MARRRRPNPGIALQRILKSPDFVMAEERMREYLADAWDHGYSAGVRDGIDDATKDEPGPGARNPYREPLLPPHGRRHRPANQGEDHP